MTDRHVAVLAVGVWSGALLPTGGSYWVAAVVAAAAFGAWRRRRPLVLLVIAPLLASLLAGAAWSGIKAHEPGRFVGQATLTSDPEPVRGGVRVTASIRGRSYDLRAWGSPAGWLRPRLMGERVNVEVKLRPLSSDAPAWLRAQGLSGRGTVTSVEGFDVGAPHTRLANSIRRTIESGAESLSRDERALFAGLVYGDDRNQSPVTADNFDAAGLTHLLAVSGQNVAFVLAITGPVLRRLEYRQRFVFVVGVLILFATVTRFEPSVVRASVMTAVAAVAALVGTEVSSRRILALAISVLILAQPLIVHSVAFQLSVAASAGILLWSARVARALPGPRWLAESFAVTAAAQIAVAPLLIWRFDGLPVASLPANVLAGPAAGPVMMWGLTAGLVAGWVPGWVAALGHIPTRAGLWWIDGVASWAASLPLGRLGGLHIAVLFVGAAVGLRQYRRGAQLAAVALLVVVLMQPAVARSLRSPSSAAVGTESFVWQSRDVTVLLLEDPSRPQDLLSDLRSANVEAVDLIVAKRSSYGTASMIRWIEEQYDVGAIWAPTAELGVGETVAPPNTVLMVGGVELGVVVDGETLELEPTIPNQG